MMKKKLKSLVKVFPLLLSCSLVGCGNINNTTNTTNGQEQSTNQSSESQTHTQNNESESQNEEVKPYKDIIEKHRKFITAISDGSLKGDEDEEEWMEQPWAYLISHFNYLKDREKRDLRQEACYALKDINNDGTPELILLLNDYTIQAIYTIAKDGTPRLVDHYWERHHGYLYKSIPEGNEDESIIYICSYAPGGVYCKMELALLQDFAEDTRGLSVDEIYVYDESETGKTYPYYAADVPVKLYDTHYFYSNTEIGLDANKPITKQDFDLAIEKYATTDQTKKVGLELKPIF